MDFVDVLIQAAQEVDCLDVLAAAVIVRNPLALLARIVEEKASKRASTRNPS
jgi:hypothetical protein